jgi:protein-L-isoaspartate O-methyltransferase
LREQLAIGGRLVMPVGASTWQQHLVRITRRSAQTFDETDLGGVMFVPLVGEHGWAPGTDR